MKILSMNELEQVSGGFDFKKPSYQMSAVIQALVQVLWREVSPVLP